MDFFVILVFIIAPLSLFLHELAHGIVAYFFQSSYIYIQLGVGPSLLKQKHGVFRISICLYIFLGALVAYERDPEHTMYERAVISIAGPFINAFLVLLGFVMYYVVDHPYISLFIAFNIWITTVNLIPFKFANKKSDGYVIAEALWNRVFSSNK
ncbi:site-2 protease family protein [Pontibacillus yanchengensis]|nr:site-2 protease family protein [Pontibacillus yanchengensis]